MALHGPQLCDLGAGDSRGPCSCSLAFAAGASASEDSDFSGAHVFNKNEGYRVALTPFHGVRESQEVIRLTADPGTLLLYRPECFVLSSTVKGESLGISATFLSAPRLTV